MNKSRVMRTVLRIGVLSIGPMFGTSDGGEGGGAGPHGVGQL